jgi:hypothetical protein
MKRTYPAPERPARVPMHRRLTFALAALALVPTAAPAQGDGLAARGAATGEDGAESWAICAMTSAYMAEGVVEPAKQKLRAEELEMLMSVVVARFVQQRGFTLDQATEAFAAVVAARAPLYENGSGTVVQDRGNCIRAGMVSQAADKHADRLVAAFLALPPALQGALPPVSVAQAPVAPAPAAPAPAAPAPITPAPAAAAPVAPPQAVEPPPAEMDFSAALGAGEDFGAVSYRINPDGSLSGSYGYKAPGVVFTETAVPRIPGQGLAGIYDASGTSSTGSYTGTFELIEKYRIEGGAVTVYRILLTAGGTTVTGTGVYVGGTSLSAVFGADMIGRFHLGEDLAGWDMYLVRDAGNTARMSQFRFEGGHFEGSHDLLADGVLLGTATFTRDAAGVVRIAMPDGSSVVAVCAPEGVNAC